MSSESVPAINNLTNLTGLQIIHPYGAFPPNLIMTHSAYYVPGPENEGCPVPGYVGTGGVGPNAKDSTQLSAFQLDWVSKTREGVCRHVVGDTP